MKSYCTYFDGNYLAQGLAMARSLVRHDPMATLWVLALDDEATTVLHALADERLRVVPLAELLADDPALAEARRGRSRSEFIFTLTPCFVRWLVRTKSEIGALCYLDADLYFFSDPAPLWQELEQGSVVIVPHGFPSWHDDAPWYGKFNVGVLLFRDDEMGRACLDDWRTRCLESCALTRDGVHYGDQKYLDAWPVQFGGVVISRHPGVNVAPWNWLTRNFTFTPSGMRVDGQPLIVFHFAQFRRVSGSWFDSGQLEYGIMPQRLRSRLYGKYWNQLVAAETEIRGVRPDFRLARRGWRASLETWQVALLRIFWGQFWFRLGPWWWAGGGGLGCFSGRFMGWFRRGQQRWRRSQAHFAVSPGQELRVLVVTPTLGESRWLDETVASVAAHGACTHVLVGPAAVVPALAARFPRCRVVAEPPSNRSMYLALNAGVAAAEDWDAFTYINDDDLLLPDFAKVIARAATGKADLIYGGVELIGAEGQRQGAIATAPVPAHIRLLYAQGIEGVFQQGTLVLRPAWEKLGGFSRTLRLCGDSDFLARACLGEMVFVRATRRPVAAFRLRPGQLSKNRAAMMAERTTVDQTLGLVGAPLTWQHRWARRRFRFDNLPVYAERILRHGWVSFDQQIERGGEPPVH